MALDLTMIDLGNGATVLASITLGGANMEFGPVY